MPELTEKITIKESNLSEATKKDYDFRLGLFYRFSPIKSDDELIDCPTDELQELLSHLSEIRKVITERVDELVLVHNWYNNEIKSTITDLLHQKSDKVT